MTVRPLTDDVATVVVEDEESSPITILVVAEFPLSPAKEMELVTPVDVPLITKENAPVAV